ncbi:hypothetical protein HMPREF0972_00511 [Actinomyces sp. oral taxon 848 str. F0332]|nr:hypothetical protein HMPREF0972_00511 [Actinomyces sp. oral taxon 848 str. F0332]
MASAGSSDPRRRRSPSNRQAFTQRQSYANSFIVRTRARAAPAALGVKVGYFE